MFSFRWGEKHAPAPAAAARATGGEAAGGGGVHKGAAWAGGGAGGRPDGSAAASMGGPMASPPGVSWRNAPLRLGYLYSAPLVHKTGGQAKELDMQDGMQLDVGQELARLKRTLQDAQRRIMFRAEVATVKNCRKLLTLGCRMLHYTGIGKPSCLIFEKEKPVGETNVLSIETLTELFAAGGVRTQLVFVSARHSEIVGRAFLAAGVRHVVAMKWDAKVSDRAACIFAEFFYLSIVMGRTVRQAFEVATTAALTETGGSAAHAALSSSSSSPPSPSPGNNNEQFLLLPQDGDHDLAIFDDAEPGAFVDESPPPVPNTCDPPPVPFVGRNVVVQEVVALLSTVSQGNRCITVRGKPGIGKTALASRVAQYLAERNLFDAIYLVPLQRKDHRCYEKETLCKLMGAAIGFGDASNEREIVFLLQDKHPGGRILLVLDGPDRFLGRSNSLVQVLSHLLSRVHGLHLLITAEGSVLSSGSGRLEASSEKVVHLGPLSDVATAHMLINIAPPGFRLEEMMSRPYATRDEAYAELAASPVIRELRGHPKAIVMFAPLLEDHTLDALMDKAKQCYEEASQPAAALVGEAAAAGEEAMGIGGGSGAGGGGPGGGGGEGGLLLPGGGKAGEQDKGKELDALALEREMEEAKRYLRDLGCQRLWLEVVRQGGARQSSSMHQGVPWYRLTDALQEELRTALLDALRLLRLRVNGNPSSSTLPPSAQSSSTALGAEPPAVGVPEEREKERVPEEREKEAAALGAPGQAGLEQRQQQQEERGAERQSQSELDPSDAIRVLEPSDVQFVKDKLLGAKSAENDLVRITDFAVFCEGWVPVQHSIRSLCREWLCNSPRLLHGFLSRRQTEELLAGKKAGTFLFRFSTSHLGLLSISFVGEPSRHGAGANGNGNGSDKGDANNPSIPATQIRHFLVQVEEDGRCVVFMEPRRSRHNSVRDLVMSSASLLEFYPGVPKALALEQLRRFE